ncbi:transposase [Azospirillum brasilense]|uniref:Integrase catalytic domain-containing protein n=1 Tax=Azospirillum brasilense TaxID=192 RepID=A0A6L3ASF2_AZOBR|nr:hypothetical protein DS837_28565 [Azospirillum brasilense]
MRNGFLEGFNGRLRDECLNETQFALSCVAEELHTCPTTLQSGSRHALKSPASGRRQPTARAPGSGSAAAPSNLRPKQPGRGVRVNTLRISAPVNHATHP